jgi:hypothetical protein
LEIEMTHLPLDTDTADRLFAGSVAPEDAPPGYGAVALLLAAAAEPSGSDDFAREAQTVAAVAAVVRSSQAQTTQPPGRSIMPRLKLASAFATIAIATTTGLAFAGSLPGAAQDVAANMLAKVGVSVPGPNSNSVGHADVRGSNEAPATPSSEGKGSEISALATSTDLTGVAKGAAISTLASDGRSRAGQNGEAGTHAAPVATPNAGGTATADTASGGQSSNGTSQAEEESDGHSNAGSTNSAEGQSHRP